MKSYHIDPDITKAQTLPGEFYSNVEVFDALKEKVFNRTWQYIGDKNLAPITSFAYPFTLLDNFLSEPLVLVNDPHDGLLCMSNVCTHRGNIVVQSSGVSQGLQCRYHGRRFKLNGAFKSMPEFEGTENFPRPCDDLKRTKLYQWGGHLFTSLDPAYEFQEVLDYMSERVGFLPLEEFNFHQELSKEYLINCHWALYCDNYLEGFHIPFVHADLNASLDYGNYTTELSKHATLQIGYSNEGEEVFDLPRNHPDTGKNVAAYYYWIFPNMMFNFYPWGLSINIVQPISTEKTRVRFLTYVYDESKLHSGAGAQLDKVEREDEFVVENVHRGLKSKKEYIIFMYY
jgi:choline monooxygenase